ncbi:MAG: HAD-IA family hydrolase [Bacteroidota bacterium]
MKQFIIFDCDGVIVDSEILAIEVLLSSLKPYGYSSTVQKWASEYSGLRTRDILDLLRRRHGLPLPEDFYEQNRSVAKQRFQKDLTAVPGMPELILSLSVCKAVVSNSKQNHVALCLEKANLSACFDPHIYTSDMVVHSKPAPDLYLLALEQLNASPDKCIVVEDSVAGASAAIAAGIEVIGFVGGLHVTDEHADVLLKAGVSQIATDAEQLGEILLA